MTFSDPVIIQFSRSSNNRHLSPDMHDDDVKSGKYQIKWGPIFLFCLKIIILSVDLIYLIVSYTPTGIYLHVDNIHAVLNIPAGLIGIYCYNIYLGPIGQYLGDSSRKHMGTILLMEYILFDVLRLFYVFLSGELLEKIQKKRLVLW